jgi:hypothetical protein
VFPEPPRGFELRAITVVLAGIALVACSSTTSPDSRLPGSIRAAVDELYPGQRVVFAETRATGSGEIHALILDRDGLRTVVHLEPDGSIRWERAEILPSEVPPAIVGTVRKDFPDTEIPMAIRFREGEQITYELRLLDTSGLTSRLELTPAGMIVPDIDGEGIPGPDPSEK